MSDANPPAEDMADEEPDEPPAMSNVVEDAAQAANTPPTTPAEPTDTGSKLVTYVEYATFGILCLLALVATFRFYFSASNAIGVWFNPDFVPVFQAVFNLIILVASAIGVSVLVRRIA